MIHDLTKTAPLEHVYNVVAGQLLSMDDTSDQPVFRHVGMYAEPPADDEAIPSFPLPAALIEISSVEWDLIGEEEESALVILTLHLWHTRQDDNGFSAYRLLFAAGKEIKAIDDVTIGEPVKVSTLVNNSKAAYLSVSETYNLYTANQLLE